MSKSSSTFDHRRPHTAMPAVQATAQPCIGRYLLAFNNDTDAVRDFAALQNACLDTSRLPDLDPTMAARLLFETQVALAAILARAVRYVESRQPNEPDA